ncbi:MAG: YggT family protein [Burkholderiales bacterium]|nr:YggT family protein [Anaerolineae bacterium]
MNSILYIIGLALQIFQFILLARVLLTWFPNIDQSNPLIRLVYQITEPVLAPIRQAIPPERTGMMDISPIVVFLIIIVLRQLIF